jgi:hypothetical protein
VYCAAGDGYDKEYEKEGYKYDGDYYADKPECGPEQFPELKDALCVNTKTGGWGRGGADIGNIVKLVGMSRVWSRPMFGAQGHPEGT